MPLVRPRSVTPELSPLMRAWNAAFCRRVVWPATRWVSCAIGASKWTLALGLYGTWAIGMSVAGTWSTFAMVLVYIALLDAAELVFLVRAARRDDVPVGVLPAELRRMAWLAESTLFGMVLVLPFVGLFAAVGFWSAALSQGLWAVRLLAWDVAIGPWIAPKDRVLFSAAEPASEIA